MLSSGAASLRKEVYTEMEMSTGGGGLVLRVNIKGTACKFYRRDGLYTMVRFSQQAGAGG